MAFTKEQIRDTYPLPVYNYKVTVLKYDYAGTVGIDQKVEPDTGAPTISFAEVSGLSVEYEPVVYKHGFSFAMGYEIIDGQKKPIHLTMKRGVYKGQSDLYDWFMKGRTTETLVNVFFGRNKRDILIDLCDKDGKAVVRWTVTGALPVKLTAPTFDTQANAVAIETLELIAQDLKVNYHLG